MKKILLVLLSLAMLFACDLGSDSDSKKEDEKKVTEPEVTTPEVVLSRGKLKDSNNVLIGYILESDMSVIKLVTPKGYIFRMSWDGSLKESHLAFTEKNAGGIPFDWFEEVDGQIYSKYVTYSNGKYFIFKDHGNGLSKENTTITHYNSRMHSSYIDGIENQPSPVDVSRYGKLFELVEMSSSELDIPMTRNPPFTISYE